MWLEDICGYRACGFVQVYSTATRRLAGGCYIHILSYSTGHRRWVLVLLTHKLLLLGITYPVGSYMIFFHALCI